MPTQLVGRAHFGRTAPQSIPHNVNSPPLTSIRFDNTNSATATDDFNTFNAAQPSRITVPAGYGINFAQLHGMVFFETRVDWATGVAMIAKNGGPGIGLSHFCHAGLTEGAKNIGNSGYHPVGNMSTPMLEVNQGDYFEILVVQANFGGAAVNTVGAGLTTWLCADFYRRTPEPGDPDYAP